MGFSKPTQPRRGCDAFGPGALPRRAVPTQPAAWRRPLAALVLAGGIGAMGMATAAAAPLAPAEASQNAPAPRAEQSGPSQDSNERCPKRAQPSSEQAAPQEKTQQAKPRRAAGSFTGSSSNSYSYSNSPSSSSSSSSSDTSSSESITTASAASISAEDGAAPPLAAGSYSLSAAFGATGSWSSYHTGQDFSASTGTPIYAVVSGTVVSGNVGSWAGNYVAIQAADGSSTLYAHLNGTTVSVGDTVSAGQQIGTVGSTGRSFGSHLHFEYYPAGVTPGDVYSATNPMTYLQSLGISM